MSSEDTTKKKKKRVCRPLSGAVPTTEDPEKRSNTTLADRIAILDFMDENPKLSQGEVAAHYQKNGFPTMNQSTISRIVGQKTKLRAEAENAGNLSFKRPRLVEYPAVEEALVAWVLQAQTKGIRITGEVLRQKARRFAELEGIDMTEFLSLSNGWLDGLKARQGLKQYRFHGEAGSIAEDDVSMEQARLKKLTDQYALRDILNMDETGLNDRMPPDRGLATAPVEFLSPNLTSRIQPNDGGIIKAFKAHYKSLFCKRAIDREELGEVDIYKIDQLEAIRAPIGSDRIGSDGNPSD